MSSIAITTVLGTLLCAAMAGRVPRPHLGPDNSSQNSPRLTAQHPTPAADNDPAQLFQRGEDALAHGQLDRAERSFRQVLAIDPKSGGAYANLGVVYMRRKQWTSALANLNKARQLLPQVPGIRLNIALAYYRQNEFLKAIPPLESVVRNQPDSIQAQYLLGQCYFFVERFADAVRLFEPLWPQLSAQLDYVYVTMIASNRAGRRDLDEKAFQQLIQIGGNSPELHLFLGKAHLNRGELDMAVTEFQTALQADPRLPFVHFNLGLAYQKKQEHERARDEFLKDSEIEPDLALNYEELGNVYWLMQQDTDAEKNYREAIRRDPHLVKSLIGLAKIYQRRQKYAEALAAIDSAKKVDPARKDVHYVRAQILLHLGRKAEAQHELDASRAQSDDNNAVPSPELTRERQ